MLSSCYLDIHERTSDNGTNRETIEGRGLRKQPGKNNAWELRKLIRENLLNESGSWNEGKL